jgi:hypothetical protein
MKWKPLNNPMATVTVKTTSATRKRNRVSQVQDEDDIRYPSIPPF